MFRWLVRLTAAGVVSAALGVVVLTENAFHNGKHAAAPVAAASALARETGSAWEPVSMSAADGAIMDAWLFAPRQPNGAAALVLHGVDDTRVGMLGHARPLLAAGFAVLAPDSRAHGASGGTRITYGWKEADDVRRWAQWLSQKRHTRRVYGAGQSMGAAIVLQSLRAGAPFRAVLADCPFASFEEISYDRMRQIAGLPRPAAWPLIRFAFFYARLRFSADLDRVAPLEVVRSTNVPVLLVHGLDDTNIPSRHSRLLYAASGGRARLWEVPGADHVRSLQVQPEEYGRAMIAWFSSHP